MRADAVLCGRAMSSGEFLAGLLLAAQVATVVRPDKLPADLFPDDDPAVVQKVWQRALAVGWYAGRLDASPDLYRERLQVLQGQLTDAAFHAMAGSVGRSLQLVAPEMGAHPADGEGPRGH